MIPILSGNVATALGGAYEVANSCRFNDDDTAYLHRTPGSEGNRKKWTFSCWFKRGNLGGGFHRIFGGNANASHIYFSDDKLYWDLATDGSGSVIGSLQTTRLFRDPGAWYHIVCALDTEQGTAGNRMRMYINGTEETVFNVDTNPDEDLATNTINDTTVHTIGYRTSGQGSAGGAFDGYMAEVVFIDGLQLTASSFGEFDEDSPTIWKPKDVSGLTFGTNGFYLDFEDSGDLGDDESGNGNDWTEVNLAATDQATDTPTNSFCTMNPLDNYYPASTFSEGNNYIVSGSSPYSSNTATMGVSSGKWYYELKYVARGGSEDLVHVGIKSKQDTANTQELGHHSTDYGYRAYNGQVRNNDSDASHGDTFAVNDIIGVYIDLDNNKLYFAKNGTVQNSGTGVSITAAASTDFGFYLPAISWNDGSTTGTMALNFGGCPAFSISSAQSDKNGFGQFEYDPSSGTFDGSSKDFLAICTKNLGSDGG